MFLNFLASLSVKITEFTLQENIPTKSEATDCTDIEIVCKNVCDVTFLHTNFDYWINLNEEWAPCFTSDIYNSFEQLALRIRSMKFESLKFRNSWSENSAKLASFLIEKVSN